MTHIYDQSINNPQDRVIPPPQIPINTSAVSWGAIFAGAAAATSLALIMLMLGSGLGLMSVSPWENHGVDAGSGATGLYSTAHHDGRFYRRRKC